MPTVVTLLPWAFTITLVERILVKPYIAEVRSVTRVYVSYLTADTTENVLYKLDHHYTDESLDLLPSIDGPVSMTIREVKTTRVKPNTR